MRSLVISSFIMVVVLAASVAFAQDNGEPPPPTELELPLTSDLNYTVRAGDVLDTIAARFDVQIDCLRETNDLARTDIIRPGDTLLISLDCPFYDGARVVEFPRSGAAGAGAIDADTADTDTTTAPVTQPAAGGENYTIQPGDTLDVIGQTFNVSVISLQRANDITNSRSLRAGQTILIPANAPPYGVFPADPIDVDGEGVGGGVDGELYVIQPGDTLDVIGQRLDVSVVSLRVVNEISNSRSLRAGHTILIPAGAPPYGVFPALDMPELDGDGVGGGVDGELYVIQPGDTLDVIAQERNISLISLKVVNDIASGRTLRAGQTILIPANAPPYGTFPALDTPDLNGDGVGGGVDGEFYVIQPLETIDGISARYNADTRCVLEANNITNSRRVFPGQTIIIPAGCPAYAGFDVPGERTTPLPEPIIPDDDEDGEAPPTGEG